jgi:hypothetical protein
MIKAILAGPKTKSNIYYNGVVVGKRIGAAMSALLGAVLL